MQQEKEGVKRYWWDKCEVGKTCSTANLQLASSHFPVVCLSCYSKGDRKNLVWKDAKVGCRKLSGLQIDTRLWCRQRRSRSCPISFCGKSHLAQLDGNWVMAVCLEIRLRTKWWMNCIAQKILYTAVMPVFSRSIAVVTMSSCPYTVPFSSLPLNSPLHSCCSVMQ